MIQLGDGFRSCFLLAYFDDYFWVTAFDDNTHVDFKFWSYHLVADEKRLHRSLYHGLRSIKYSNVTYSTYQVYRNHDTKAAMLSVPVRTNHRHRVELLSDGQAIIVKCTCLLASVWLSNRDYWFWNFQRRTQVCLWCFPRPQGVWPPLRRVTGTPSTPALRRTCSTTRKHKQTKSVVFFFMEWGWLSARVRKVRSLV